MQYFGFDRPSFGIKTFGFGANFDPLTLFAGGKQGVIYDPSDKSTLFQDVAGTVPVTKDGDPVALMRDKSGNNNHATQSVSTARPVYKTDGILHWLAFDGVDDKLAVTYAISLPQPVSYHLAVNVISTANGDIINGSIANQRHNIFQFDDKFVFFSGAEINTGIAPSNTPIAFRFVFNGTSSRFAKNGVVSAAVNVGTDPAKDLLIGGIAFKFYGLVKISTLIGSSNSSNLDSYLAAKAGVAL